MFGNQTQGHKQMTPISRTLNAMACKARYQERNGSWKIEKTAVINYANFDLPFTTTSPWLNRVKLR